MSIAVQATADDVTYTTDENVPITFKASDFNYACDDATNETLSYVKFKLPSSTYGKLYYDYASSSDTGSSVSASTTYYRSSSPSLSRVTFVPKSGYTGTVSISYTGYNTDGDAYVGTVKVVVRGDERSQYFDDVGVSYSWASAAIDYLCRTGVVTGVAPGKYSPSASITRGNFRPTAAITRQDAMVLVARTLAVASVTMPTGNANDLAGFSDSRDVADYAVTAAGSLVKADIIRGAAGKLNPTGSITRAEMAVILYRVLTLP